MTLKALDFEVGPDAAAATGGGSGNSGANVIALGTGGSATYTATSPIYGTYSLNLLSGTTNTEVREFIDAASAGGTVTTTNNVISLTVAVTLPSTAPSANESFWCPRSATGTMSALFYATDGAIKWKDSASANTTTLLSSAQVAALTGRKVRFTLLGNRSVGSYTLKAYPIGSSTAINTLTAASAWAWGANDFGGHSAGIITSGTGRNYVIDHMALDDGSTTELGEPAAPGLPTCSAGTSGDFDEGGSITLDGTVSGATSLKWTVQTVPLGAATPTIVADTLVDTTATGIVQGVYTFRLRATNSSGNTDAFVTHYVAPPVDTASKVFSSTGAGSNDGGAVSKVVALTDASDATRVLMTVGQAETVTYNPGLVGPVVIDLGTLWVDAATKLHAEVFPTGSGTACYEVDVPLTSSKVAKQVVVDGTGLAALNSRALMRAVSVRFTCLAA